jgi:two-component system sensor histidine kinase/response regulator
LDLSFEQFFETSPLPMWVYDSANFRFLEVNQAAINQYGYSREDFLSMTLLDIRPPEGIPATMESIRRTGVHAYSAETQHRKKDGTPVDVEILAHTVSFRGQPARLVLVSDITARKRADEARAFLATIVESSDDSIVATDLSGKIVTWNRAAERMFGYTLEETVGRGIDLLFPAERKPDYLDSLDRVRRNERIERFETTRARKDGSVLDVSVILSPIKDAGNKLVGVSAIYRDITQRKQKDAELLRAKEAAEAASRVKSEFLANMSHEIRTPMNGIIGMTEVLLDSDPTDEQREYLNIVKGSAKALLTIVNDILDLSKIEACKLRLNLREFKLRESVKETIEEMAVLAREKGLALTCAIQPEVPNVVRGDETRLRQVIVNLLGNSIKFTTAGEVALRVETVPEDHGLLHFLVRDTGPGVPADKQTLIFDVFTQADNSITRKFGGTGLGLAIAARLVEMMDGRIGVESDGRSGSTFSFTARLSTPG